MKPFLTAALGAALVATTIGGNPTAAKAENGNIGLGIVGGLIGGALIGSAVAPRPYYGPPAYYDEPAPVYYRSRCYWTAGRAVWDDYRGVWVRPRVRVCD